jgi:putative ABC transport system ATP-binding protein
MEPTFFKFIWKYTWRNQLYLLLLTCVMFPFLYYSLELPKIIVNKAIGGDDALFPKQVFGLDFTKIEYLLLLCFVFLFLVFVRFGLRFYVNVYKGRLGERMLRRLRYILFERVLRFPLPHFRRASQGEIIAMITAEVEPIGGFVGEAVATPAFEGGTMLTILVFMFVQDPILGLAAISLMPVQAYLIPKLQAQVNALAKQRVRTVRKLSERVGEVVSGIETVHANDTAELERADIARWLGTIYDIRFRIYKKKFFIKFINNFLGQVTPFFFFSLGGYLVITGDLTFGALVAVLAAYKDLNAPWKELLSWYQMREDTRVKYEQLIEQFDPPGMLDAALQAIPEGPVPHLAGTVSLANVSLEEEAGIRLVDGVSLRFELGDRVALVGREGSGNSMLAKLLARLLLPTQGTIRIGEHDLATLSEAVTGRRIGYLSQGCPLFQGTIGDNLFYPLKHQPLAATRRNAEAEAAYERFRREAAESGNTTSDPNAEWIDHAAAGAADDAELLECAGQALERAGLADDVFGFGLQGTINPATQEELAVSILEARKRLGDRLTEKPYRGLVEPFDPDRFNHNMSVAENLLFGTPIGREFDLEHIAENPYMLHVLDRVGLTDWFLESGLQIARIMLELFQDLQASDDLFQRFSFISFDLLTDYQAAVRRADAGGLGQLSDADRTLFLSLPFKGIPARHRLGLLTEDMERRLLDARRVFASDLPEHLQGAVAFFDRDSYTPPASVLDNILFGRLVYGRQQASGRVRALIGEVIDDLGLRRRLIGIGLGHPIGIGGSRLSAAQRQKLAIARTLLKRPDLLILDYALAALDPASQATIMANILDGLDGAGLVWVMNDAAEAVGFDRIVMMEQGRVVEQKSGTTASAAAG